MKLSIADIRSHERGKIYEAVADGKTVVILLTSHALQRIAEWRLKVHSVLRTLLFPEEVLRGHHSRFIAHRRMRTRVVRAVYEYDGRMPVVITVYYPSAKRYFQGGNTHEDLILS